MLQSVVMSDTKRRNLIEARKRVRLSQERLADRLAVNRVTVARWEIGANDPSLAMALQIGQVLGFRVEQLFGDEPLFTPEEQERQRAETLRILAKINRARTADTAEPMTHERGDSRAQHQS